MKGNNIEAPEKENDKRIEEEGKIVNLLLENRRDITVEGGGSMPIPFLLPQKI